MIDALPDIVVTIRRHSSAGQTITDTETWNGIPMVWAVHHRAT